ncbi:hypothetical protein QYE76_049795 [Lolium multiflorum]|uniref:Uncharacterized protein n=1 Tax=Lolium multiflorum TaxID=4521 RepID=A0AAD8SNQ5_LOLMU|nr:hypothetical protein QYE76_049795 [Lolium multiflorum]
MFRIPLVYDTEAAHDAVWRSTCLILTVAAKATAVVSGKGFVQGIVTYTVMDDLAVTPMSSISSITLLNTFAVKDLTALQEKTVPLGYNEGLEILKASLQSKTVLTDVFLGKKPPSIILHPTVGSTTTAISGVGLPGPALGDFPVAWGLPPIQGIKGGSCDGAPPTAPACRCRGQLAEGLCCFLFSLGAFL